VFDAGDQTSSQDVRIDDVTLETSEKVETELSLWWWDGTIAGGEASW
jgi:hypothetical protein